MTAQLQHAGSVWRNIFSSCEIQLYCLRTIWSLNCIWLLQENVNFVNTALDDTLCMSKGAFSNVSVIAWVQCFGILVEKEYLVSLSKLDVPFIPLLKSPFHYKLYFTVRLAVFIEVHTHYCLICITMIVYCILYVITYFLSMCTSIYFSGEQIILARESLSLYTTAISNRERGAQFSCNPWLKYYINW